MTKAATVQARVEVALKKKADIVLQKIGVSPSQVINALYAQIVMQKGIPFALKIPNKETTSAIKELEAGGGKTFSSVKDMIDDLENNNA